MCGIFGVIHKENVTANLVSGLKSLSYRGYDSAGIAVINQLGITRCRAEGKINNLESKLQSCPLTGRLGIAHTRWATHGLPNETNAHPHMTEKVAVVHNGVIENYVELREELEAQGCTFKSETDSESIAHLITQSLNRGLDNEKALSESLKKLRGSFSIVAIFHNDDKTLYVAKQGSPLVIGIDNLGCYVSSDENALFGKATYSCHLKDGDIALIQQETLTIKNSLGIVVERPTQKLNALDACSDKKGFAHYMLKEIHEQPEVLKKTVNAYIDKVTSQTAFSGLDFSLLQRLSIIACGTSYYAGMVAKYWMEGFAGLRVNIDIASEYRYRGAPVDEDEIAMFISQSGETADTRAALEYSQSMRQKCLSLVNVKNSSIANLSDVVLNTHAGPEIGVASTKAFTSQLSVMLLMAIYAARKNQFISVGKERELIQNLYSLPQKMEALLAEENEINTAAQSMFEKGSALYLGRGIAYPLALEGALKLKEISYIHAEAYAAGELKHGPLALIDENMPVVVIAPSNDLFDKTLTNLREVASRGGKIILISDETGIEAAQEYIDLAITMPEIDPLFMPLMYSLPLQLLAYQVSVLKGTNIDQPRNLAKSVTVE